MKERVIIYIDGFNLYFGICDAKINGKWLDLFQLSQLLLKPDQELVAVKYFTSHISNDPSKQKRQLIYLEALKTTAIEIFYGHYQKNPFHCNICGNSWMSFNEKMTDVNIASEMLVDAFQDKFDMALLVSGDSDLVPPIKKIHSIYTNKRVTIAFPPNRHNYQLALVAKGSFLIGKAKIRKSQLPDEITTAEGYVLNKPPEWN